MQGEWKKEQMGNRKMKQHYMTYLQFFNIKSYLLTRYRRSGKLDQPVHKVANSIQKNFGFIVTKNNLRTVMRATGFETYRSKRSIQDAHAQIKSRELAWNTEELAIIKFENFGLETFTKRYYPILENL